MAVEAINTLIVDADPLLAETHRLYLEKLPGFTVTGVAHRAGEALNLISHHRPHLVLLDFMLPRTTGLQVCRDLRSHGQHLDIIAVTSASDVSTVRAAASYGVVQYLVKPFGFTLFRDRLERYAASRRQIASARPGPLTQREVDFALAALRPAIPDAPAPPKGVTAVTLDAVVAELRTAAVSLSAEDLASAVGVSRPTARRYLEYLADRRLAVRTQRYGLSGRPRNLYRWKGH